jgi:hypothetical protein
VRVTSSDAATSVENAVGDDATAAARERAEAPAATRCSDARAASISRTPCIAAAQRSVSIYIGVRVCRDPPRAATRWPRGARSVCSHENAAVGEAKPQRATYPYAQSSLA